MPTIAIFGVCMIAVMVATPFVIYLFSEERKRNRARAVLALITDGRPPGCTCPPNPGMNTLPSDNQHIGSPRCGLTAVGRR